MGAGAAAAGFGAAGLRAAFLAGAFAGALAGLAFFADFAADFLADFFADLAAFFAGFLADFFAAFFEVFFAVFLEVFFEAFFFAVTTFLALFFLALSFLPFLFFFPLAIVILLLPPINVYRSLFMKRFKSCASNRPHFMRGQSISPANNDSFRLSSVQAGNRPSPNQEAQSCEPQELTCRRQSAPCIRYCPQRSYPA